MFPTYYIQSTWSATEVATPIAFVRCEAEVISSTETGVRQLAFSVTVSRIVDLLSECGSDAFGEHSPTQYAFRTVLMLVQQAEVLLGEAINGSVSTDSKGGIRV